ncbi:Pectate lyase [Globisporangium polare]
MVKSFSVAALALAAIIALTATSTTGVSAAAMPTGTWPASKGTVKLSAPQVVKAGTTFDGGMKTYELANVKCQGQTESSKNTMVFLVEPGATLKNVIIGKNQMEGVHCEKHGCTIENVWWDDVCEDALSIKGGSASSVSKVIGGGARYAEDKVIQHNGPGSVSIDGFYAQDFGKLYRSCGTCGDVKRSVTVSNVYAVNPSVAVVTVNKNYGDQAKLSNIKIKASKKKVVVCAWSQGVAKGEGEPKKLGDGPSGTLCQYSTSSIQMV